MKFLFIHNNYPAQFRHLVTALVKCNHAVIFLSLEKTSSFIPGVKHIVIQPNSCPTHIKHSYNQNELIGWQKKFDISQYFFAAFNKLLDQGFVPDFVFSHAGWGAGLFVKSIFPFAKLACYAEWWFQWYSDDQKFDLSSKYSPVFSTEGRKREQYTNMFQSSELAIADFIWTPTLYQKNQYPPLLRNHIEVIHEGVEIDYEVYKETRSSSNSVPFSPITYATRGMEPIRGFEHFTKILGMILANDDSRFAYIGGKDKIFYRKISPQVKSLKEEAEEYFNKKRIDPNRLNWTGLLNYSSFKNMLLKSGLHIYFTRPFVPSWSLIDAMASGCLIVASDIECVREIVSTGNGKSCAALIDHTDHMSSVNAIERLIHDSKKQRSMREQAFDVAFDRYNSSKQLPKLLDFFGLAKKL